MQIYITCLIVHVSYSFGRISSKGVSLQIIFEDSPSIQTESLQNYYF